MPQTWKHRELGHFTWDIDRWIRNGGPDDEYDLFVETEGCVPIPPCDEASALAYHALKGRDKFVAGSISYLWDEMVGKRISDNWWAKESLGNRPLSREELAKQIQLGYVSIRYFESTTGKSVVSLNPFTKGPLPIDPAKIPVARPAIWAIELSFVAEFEEEHGIGVLWHNNNPISSGFGSGDVEPPDGYLPIRC